MSKVMSTVRSGTVDRDGFLLQWVREGRGTPMLVIGSERWYRRYFPQSLRSHFDMVFCDSRQWVPTPPGFDISTITCETFSDDIDALCEVVGFDRPIVMGQSQHGSMALEHARRHPDRVRGAIAVATGPPPTERTSEVVREFVETDLDSARRAVHEHNLATRRVPAAIETAQDLVDAYVVNAALGWFDATFDGRPLWEGVEANVPVMLQIIGPDGLGAYGVPMDVPVFLALGRYDYGVPHRLWDELRRCHPRIHYRLYERSAHNPPYEEPDAFVTDLVNWAARL